MDSNIRLRAGAHTTRLQILSLLTGSAMSAAEVGRELGMTHANASYHLRRLLAAGELEIVAEEKIRGGVAKRYHHPWREVSAQQQPPPNAEDRLVRREQFVRAMAEELIRRARLAQGTDSAYSDAELWVAPEVYDRALALVLQASGLLHDSAQPPRTEGAVHVNLSAAIFQMDTPSGSGPVASDGEES